MPTPAVGATELEQQIKAVLDFLQVAENDREFLAELAQANVIARDEAYEALKQSILGLFPLITTPNQITPAQRLEINNALYVLKVKKLKTAKIGIVLDRLKLSTNDRGFLDNLEVAYAADGNDKDYERLRQIIVNLFPLVHHETLNPTGIIKEAYAIVPFRQEFDEELYRLKIRRNQDLANCTCLAWWANLADKSMTAVYLLFIVAGVVYSIATLAGFNIPIFSGALFQTASSDAWNYHDAVAGVALAIFQLRNGQGAIGIINLLSSLQITALTFAGSWQIMFHVWLVSAVLSGAFLGFSFAVSMFAGFVIELIEVRRANELTAELRKQYKTLTEDGTVNLDNPEAIRLLEQIKLSEANSKNHTHNSYAWLACTVAMTIIASAALLTALTGGGFLAVPVIAAIGGLLSAAIRIHLTTDWLVRIGLVTKQDAVTELTKIKYKDKAPEALSKFNTAFPNGQCDLTFGQETVILNLNTPVPVGIFSFFTHEERSMKQHITNLLKTDPLKADRLWVALNNHDLKSFRHEIKTGDREGIEIYNQLTQQPAAAPSPAPMNGDGETEAGGEHPH